MNFVIKVIQPSDFAALDAMAQFQSEIDQVLRSGADIVLVDLTNLTSLSSQSFLTLIKGLKTILGAERQLFLCSLNEQLRILFEITGLDQVFHLFTSHDEFHQYIQPMTKVEKFRPAKVAVAKPKNNALKLAG